LSLLSVVAVAAPQSAWAKKLTLPQLLEMARGNPGLQANAAAPRHQTEVDAYVQACRARAASDNAGFTKDVVTYASHLRRAATLVNVKIKVEGDAVPKLLKLIEMLEENEDVKTVSANYDIDDALIEKYSE
jgi:hypothetical protein